MHVNMNEWKNSLLISGKVKALPIMTSPGLELAGKKVIDVLTKAEDQYLCMAKLAERYPSAAAVSMMDLSIEAEAFGSQVRFFDNEIPVIVNKIVTDMDSVAALAVPAVGAGRTAVGLKALELAARQIGDRPVLGGQIGPFSLAGRLMDMTDIMIAAIEEPEVVHAVLEKTTAFLVEYAKAMKSVGGNGVIIAEPAAGLLSPRMCDEFSSRYVEKIVAAVQDEDFIVIIHNCGNTTKLVSSLLSTGAQAFHFGNAVKMTDIIGQIPPDKLVLGNIDPANIIMGGSEKQIEEKIVALLEDMKEYNNFVLSSGCDIPVGTPLSNIDILFKTLADYNFRK